MKTAALILTSVAIGAWSQNLAWDLTNLALDYGLWFSFVPVVPAVVAIVLMKTGGK